MGLFSGRTEVYVASTIYNLAGDQKDRVSFLKSTVAGGVLDPQNRGASIGKGLVDAQLKGPGLRQSSFFRWARDNYEVGMPQVSTEGVGDITDFDPTPYIPLPIGSTATVNVKELYNADYTKWAEKHIKENRPSMMIGVWTSEYFDNNNTIKITYEDLTEEIISAGNYDKDGRYLYVDYTERTPNVGVSAAWAPFTQRSRVWIYKIGTGIPAIDNLNQQVGRDPTYYPVIPLRIDNKAISDPSYSDIYPKCKAAYKKLTGNSITKILNMLEENEDVGDIDHAFLVMGVPFNTRSNDGRRYIYEYFKQLIPFQTWNQTDYENWRSNVLNGPEYYSGPSAKYHNLSLATRNTVSGISTKIPYDIRITWSSIGEDIFTGVYEPGANPGDVKITKGRPFYKLQREPNIRYSGEGAGEEYIYYQMFNDEVYMYHQVDSNTYRRLTVSGLLYINSVYGNEKVYEGAYGAFIDPDESGFIIPMHEPTLRSLPLIMRTQIATENNILVLNSFEVVKRKWYETGFFRILLTIVIAIVTAFVFPGAVGILGSNLAVGTSLGLTGTAALIAGSVANALVAVMLTTLVSSIGGAFEKLGVLLGAILTFAVGQAVGSLMNGGMFNFNVADMFRAENLLKMTDALATSSVNWAQSEMEELQSELDTVRSEYETQVAKIQNLTEELLGYSGVLINPLQFTQLNQAAPRAESSDTFLARTLLTGSDLSEVSLNVIENFAEISLKLPDYQT